MKGIVPMDFEIDFADSKIISYLVKDYNVVLLLESWNAKMIEIRFLNFVSLSAMNCFRIADMCEIFESPLLDRALNELYEERPQNHNLRIFRFLNSDDMTALEIVSEDIEIKKLRVKDSYSV